MDQRKRYPRTILASCCVPWNEDWSIAEAIFRDQVRLLVRGGFEHLYIFGTAGEGYAVSEAQFDRVVELFAQEMKGADVQAMVGVISLSMSTVIERIERAAEKGFHRFQISLPSWGTLSEGELMLFFREVLGRFPDYEFLHYNLPRTKRIVTPGEYHELCRRHDNLVATKNSTDEMQRMYGLQVKAPLLQHFFTHFGFAYGSLVSECGYLISSGVLNPALSREYFQAGIDRDPERLMMIQGELQEMSRDMVGAVGSGFIDGGYDKLMCKLLDPRFPLRLLPPYAYASDEDFEVFRSIVETRYPRWYPSPS